MDALRAVLIVDDDPGIRQVLNMALTENGYAVWEAESAAAAVRVFREHRIDFVLSDVNMPDRMGPELLRDLQNIDKDVRFCFMTAGNMGTYSMTDLMDAGALQVLEKPFTLESLRSCIDEALVRPEPEVPNPSHHGPGGASTE